jgi:hypothetical protein
MEKQKGPVKLVYQDYKQLEKVIESYNTAEDGRIDFNTMPDDEKAILWKIKRIVMNMESVRLRTTLKEESKNG